MLMFMGGSALASDWTLAYAHDENGTVTTECSQRPDCSLDILKQAIADGAEVRVVNCPDANGYFAARNFTDVAVEHIPGHVTAIQFKNSPVLDTQTNTWVMQMMRLTQTTNGKTAYQIGGEEPVANQDQCMSWYVR